MKLLFSWQINTYEGGKREQWFLRYLERKSTGQRHVDKCSVFPKDAVEIVFPTALLPSTFLITWAAWNQSRLSHFLPQLRVTSGRQVQKASCQQRDFHLGCRLQLPSRKWRNPQGPKLWSLNLHTACPRKSWVMPCSSGQTRTSNTLTSHILRVRGLDAAELYHFLELWI